MKQPLRSFPRIAASVTDLRMTLPRRVRWMLPALVLLAVAGVTPSFAQGKLEAQYEATLAGIPVGRGAWNIEITDDQFSASAVGGTAGLLKSFSSSSGTGSAQGRVVNGALVSTNYSASTTTSKKSEAIHM